jgi:hypothetical protein
MYSFLVPRSVWRRVDYEIKDMNLRIPDVQRRSTILRTKTDEAA